MVIICVVAKDNAKKIIQNNNNNNEQSKNSFNHDYHYLVFDLESVLKLRNNGGHHHHQYRDHLIIKREKEGEGEEENAKNSSLLFKMCGRFIGNSNLQETIFRDNQTKAHFTDLFDAHDKLSVPFKMNANEFNFLISNHQEIIIANNNNNNKNDDDDDDNDDDDRKNDDSSEKNEILELINFRRDNLREINYLDEKEFNESFMKLRNNFDSFMKESIRILREELILNRQKKLESLKSEIINGKKKKYNQKLKQIESKLNNNNNNNRSHSSSSTSPSLTENEIKMLESERSNILEALKNLDNSFEIELEKLGAEQKNTETKSNEDETLVDIFLSSSSSSVNDEKSSSFSFLFESRTSSSSQLSREEIEERSNNNNNIITSSSSLSSSSSSCKLKAYKHFFSLGYFVSSGEKFGGDFLVYPGEPSKYHSKFIVLCLESSEEYKSLTIKQIIAYARVATSVKKTFLIVLPAAVDQINNNIDKKTNERANNNNETNELKFLSLNWSHI